MSHYKRILLKLSGEVLGGEQRWGIAPAPLQYYVEEIAQVHKAGIAVAVIIGGGNIWRGNQAKKLGIGSVRADHMGMLATMINAVALQSALSQKGLPVRLMSRLNVQRICESYNMQKAEAHLKKGYIVIIGGGTSNPCFTTDAAAALTAIELNTDVLIKGTNVDGIYTEDPKQNPHATIFKTLTLQEVLDKQLKVMDMAAIVLCMQEQLPLIVYNATKPKRLLKLLQARKGGTFISPN